MIDVVSRIHESSGLPVLLDGDTGYGNFNNVRQLVKRLCREQIAAVCIEDKFFPKNNSFRDKGQEFADISEFCGKIKAAKDAQTHDDFSVIARVEALIAGRGMREAIRRAEAYRKAFESTHCCSLLLCHFYSSVLFCWPRCSMQAGMRYCVLDQIDLGQ